MEVISEDEVSAEDARRILSERKKEGGELRYEQKVCIDFLEKLPKLTDKQLEDVKAELAKIAILKPRYIALILNIMPDTEEEVEALFSKERTNLKKEEIKQIVEIVRQFKK
jgi:DNA-directed RNA polymerase subunit F